MWEHVNKMALNTEPQSSASTVAFLFLCTLKQRVSHIDKSSIH